MFLNLTRSGSIDGRLIINSEQITVVRPRTKGCEIHLAITDEKGKPIYYVIDEDFEEVAKLLLD